MKFTISKNNSWKALYLHSKGGKQIGHLGVDPFSDYGMLKPQVFGMVAGRVFRLNIPYIKYKDDMGKIGSSLKKIQDKFWYSLDSR